MRYIVILLALLLAGCGGSTQKKHVVIDKPSACFKTVSKPQLQNVSVKVRKLLTGKYAITVSDEEFDKVLINQLRVDQHIKASYTIQEKYRSNCKK